MSKLLKVPEMAAYLRLSEHKLRTMVRAGRVPAIRTGDDGESGMMLFDLPTVNKVLGITQEAPNVQRRKRNDR